MDSARAFVGLLIALIVYGLPAYLFGGGGWPWPVHVIVVAIGATVGAVAMSQHEKFEYRRISRNREIARDRRHARELEEEERRGPRVRYADDWDVTDDD